MTERPTQELGKVERLLLFHKTLSAIENYFAHWEGVPNLNPEKLFRKYIGRVENVKSRYELDLIMMELIADLNNGHSWFTDSQLEAEGIFGHFEFNVKYHDKLHKWIVVSSNDKNVVRGDIIARIDGEDIEKFFLRQKKYISASSERSARARLFGRSSMLFPKSFTIDTTAKKNIRVVKKNGRMAKLTAKTTGRMLADGIAYVKIPSFHNSSFEKRAVKYLRKFKKTKALILDLRDNGGGRTPLWLASLLMDRKWIRPKYKSNPKSAELWNNPKTKKSNYRGWLNWPGRRFFGIVGYIKPLKSAYKGNVYILVNESSISAPEDFTISFKYNKRATIIGSTTAGSDGDGHYFEFNKQIGFGLGIARVYWPDGKKFEGIGIKPDVEVLPSLNDVKNGRDVVLEKAMAMAEKGSGRP